jgi:hypothetical protein
MKVKSILLLILVSSPTWATKIYSWVDEDGVKHYSATQPEETDNKSNYKEKELKDGASSGRSPSSNSSISNSKTSKNQKNCTPEYEKGSDAATLRNIRSYYSTRTSQCRQFYKKGSYQIKNCFQEQKEIKEKKMKEHRKRMKIRCK